jgi:hypothetical protein
MAFKNTAQLPVLWWPPTNTAQPPGGVPCSFENLAEVLWIIYIRFEMVSKNIA